MESEKLYAPYSNKKPDANGAYERMKQRLKWTNNYLKHGTCKRKLEKVGILKVSE